MNSLQGRDPVAVRRSLAYALGAHLDRRRVRDAVVLWSEQFEGQGSLFVALQRYCRQVAQSYGLAGREAELQLTVFRALQSQPSDLPQDPLSVPPGDDERTAPTPLSEAPRVAAAAGASASAAVMQAFYAAVEEQLVRDLPPGVTPVRVRRTFIRYASGLPRPRQHAASLWWSNQVPLLSGDWPPGGHGTALVNVIYVALAELLGPRRADECLTQAVMRLERSGEPGLTDIRRWL